jgi:glycerol-3-phosphate O-acyltransferase
MIYLDAVPKTAPDVIGRNLDNEAILVLTNKAEIKVINEVGAFIWLLVDGSRSIREIASNVSQEYDVDQAQSEADTVEFVADLVQRGILLIG